MTRSSAPPPSDTLIALDDYVSGHLPDASVDAFEEDLFARAARGEAPEAEFAERFRRNAEWLARRGTFEVGNTRAEVEKLRASGLRIQYVDFGDASGPVDVPPIRTDIDYFVYRIGVDLRGIDYDTIDVIVETPSGEYVKTFRDVRYDAEDGAFYGVCEAPLAEISFRRGTVLSKVMVGKGSERRHVATLETRPVPT